MVSRTARQMGNVRIPRLKRGARVHEDRFLEFCEQDGPARSQPVGREAASGPPAWYRRIGDDRRWVRTQGGQADTLTGWHSGQLPGRVTQAQLLAPLRSQRLEATAAPTRRLFFSETKRLAIL